MFRAKTPKRKATRSNRVEGAKKELRSNKLQSSFLIFDVRLFAEAVLNGNGNGDGRADHGVVAHAEEAHHLDVCRDGGGACELSVGVHTAHSVGHTVGGGAGGHVVGVEGTAGAAAGGNGEVLLALLDALFLVSAGNGMLEAGRVGGVSGDGNVDLLEMHDSNALADVVSAVAADICALAFRIADLTDDLQLVGEVVKLGLNVGKAVYTGDDLRGVLSETVKDNAKLLLADFVGVADDTDSALSGGEGFVTCEEGKALGFVAQKHGGKVSVTDTDLAVICDGAVDAEALKTYADIAGSLFSVLCACFQGDSCADAVCPADVLKADGLNALGDLIGIEACLLAELAAFLDGSDSVLSKYGVYFADSAIIVFK